MEVLKVVLAWGNGMSESCEWIVWTKMRQSVRAQRQGECSPVVRLEAVFVVLVGCADVLSIPETRGRTAPPRHFVTCVQVFEADLSLSCLAGWGISGALPSRFSPHLCWKWPGKWRPVPPACPHLQPPTCEETHLLRGPEQGCPAQATVCKPRAAPEQVPWSLRGVIGLVWREESGQNILFIDVPQHLMPHDFQATMIYS